MTKPLVAVLGCGPSGLLAAHACRMRGVPVVILSRKQKSPLGGAQFSHIHIPMELDDDQPEAKITYKVTGDADGYQEKVYGPQRVPFVSFGNVYDGKIVPAWSLRKLYDRLWDKYESDIVDVDLDPMRVARLIVGFDVVFSSVPLKRICFGNVDPGIGHWFRDQPVRIANEAIDPSLPDNTIWYEGSKDKSWYRMSKIFGVGSTEWGSSGQLPPVEGLMTVNKPISTNCTCHTMMQSSEDELQPTSFVKVGRFGTWSKGELTFHAFNRATDTLAELGVM